MKDMFGTRARRWVLVVVVGWSAAACGTDEPFDEGELVFEDVIDGEAPALLSVHGTAADDVWTVGADDGKGPLVLHFDGDAWQRRDTGVRGDLWWVHATREGPVFFAGSDAHVLVYDDGEFERISTPGLGKHVVFGIWAASPEDVYAVGAAAGRNGFVWHFDGEAWEALPLPDGLPEDEHRDVPAFFKVWGASEDDVWVVGGRGVILRGNAADGFELVRAGDDGILFTVHGAGEGVAVVGGENSGVLLRSDGGDFVDVAPPSTPLLQGVCSGSDGTTWAVGAGGALYRSGGGSFSAVSSGIDVPAAHSLHACWVDPDGGLWAAGGNVLTPSLDAGVLLHGGAPIAAFEIEPAEPGDPECPEDAVDPTPDGSIARRWNEQILNAIRRDVPRPTVHARNLFHVSVAVWDAWAAYDDVADGYLVRERHDADDVEDAREEAISFAAYRVLSHRYSTAIGGGVSQACFDAFMDELGFDPEDDGDEGDDPRALGNRIGFGVIAAFAEDGANEANNYADPEDYAPDNPNLVVDVPGTVVENPTLWQKLVLAEAVTQNGIPAGSGVQPYIGGHWGHVTPFALERPEQDEAYLDIGDAPVDLDGDLVDAAVDVIRRTSQLDIDDGAMLDVSPGAYGNNPLGTNDGTGYAENPATGEPYEPRVVKRGDLTRVLAEFWADGPASETPPGHWNTLANDVSDHPDFERRLFGEGEELDPLSWDVHVYLVVNGAVHDAAIAAWELKREYSSARPITLIRYMGGLGQRSDPDGPAYDEDGLPLVDDLIEVVTDESSASGERHAHLARYVGEVAVRSWRGEPGDRESEVGGVAWIRAVEWIPYQRRTFVTPAFPGYVSGHSTFSRAAAVVLADLTGSEFFPGGLFTYRLEPGYLFFEYGPTEPFELQWATYYDAADQAGQSRLYGGIHVRHDDFDGRRIGARVGAAALEHARAYFDGSAAD
jgi:hypothetical protein